MPQEGQYKETSLDWTASSHPVPQRQLLAVCVQQVQLHSSLESFAGPGRKSLKSVPPQQPLPAGHDQFCSGAIQ